MTEGFYLNEKFNRPCNKHRYQIGADALTPLIGIGIRTGKEWYWKIPTKINKTRYSFSFSHSSSVPSC